MIESVGRESGAGRLLAIVSGRGGAGKTTLALNLALALAERGRRVLVIDADMGLANIAGLLRLRPPWEASELLRQPERLDAALLPAAGGIRVLVSSHGLDWLTAAQAPASAAASLVTSLRQRFDDILIDTPAALGARVAAPAASADQVLLIITPDQTAVTDGFTLIKALARAGFDGELDIVVNMAPGESEADQLYRRFSAAIGKYSSIPTTYVGHVSEDRAVTAAAVHQVPVLLHAPASGVAGCFGALAQRLLAGTAAAARPQATPAAPEPFQPAAPRGRAPDARELVYSLLEGPGMAEPAFRELLHTLESIYRTRFGQASRDPLDHLLEALEADAVPEAGLRLLLPRLHRRLYGEPLEDRIAPLLQDLLGSTTLSEDRWDAVRTVLDAIHRQQYGEPLSGPPPELKELVGELARQRPELEALRDSYSQVAKALAAVEARLRERAGLPPAQASRPALSGNSWET